MYLGTDADSSYQILGGTAHTCMVACVSPSDVDVSETLNTRWAKPASCKNVAVRGGRPWP